MADEHTLGAAARVRRYYEMVDSGDVDGMLALFADDVVYERPGCPPLRGIGEIEAFYRPPGATARGVHTLTSVVVDLPHVAVHGEFSGTPDGEPLHLKFADFFELDDEGCFARRHTFFYVPSG